jgi:hypothetical protein
MRRSRSASRFASAALASCILAAGSAAASAADRFDGIATGAVLYAGETARLEWSLERPAGGFAEMELVLSLDGGRTFPVRVTRDLDPGTRSFVWRVPALPTAHARLALRAGDGGEPGAEEVLLVSEEFAIEADSAEPLEPMASVRGEWRTREALDGGHAGAPPDPRTLGASVPFLLKAHDLPTAAAPRPRPLAEASGARRAAVFESALEGQAEPLGPDLARMPVDAPKRE